MLDTLLVDRLLKINPNRQLKNIDPDTYNTTSSLSQSIAENNKIPMYLLMETQAILNILVSRFLKDAIVKSKIKDPRIKKCLQYIHENINKQITISQLKDISCTSEDHFARLFKKETSYAPIKYIQVKKMERAQLLLLTTDMSIGEIAIKLSIGSSPYFNRLFQQHTNMTPRKYRDLYRSANASNYSLSNNSNDF